MDSIEDLQAIVAYSDQLGEAFFAVDRDWRSEVARIYDFLGLPLTAAAERRMTAYLGTARSHHQHRYALADFGLDEGDVRRLLPDQA